MNIGLDLDGVLYDWHTSVYNYYVQFRNYEGSWSDFWYKKMYEISKETWDMLVQVDIFYSDRDPSQSCMKFLSALKDDNELFYITSRPECVHLTTEQYLHRYDFPYQENLIFTQDKVNMSRLCRIDHFVEDNKHNVENLSKVTNAILFARPWNVDLWDKYPTAHSLSDALDIITNGKVA